MIMYCFVIILNIGGVFCMTIFLWLDLPNRPGAPSGGGKKPASGNMPGIGISLGDLSNIKARLKKVSSEEKKDSEVPDTTPAPQEKPNTDSFQGRMNLFKQAEGEAKNTSRLLYSSFPILKVTLSVKI